ncbi:outer membrane lipoprotein carrier protein LolA [Rhodosalinus sediminis]|uniref:Outer membrane lipoprotein carrier protein LolA n=1 Tax=Rhodosalinus sediminis TaxID=1940533 RepID=A0A3D9BP32_9RHOB|nr:outer membrane lipoprotein carrier protein LolA [Rhodosalinus sediminis]REC55268.1 outer membrane lipoprotein carrier protein LolA [Rhodosalinus sediminis]
MSIKRTLTAGAVALLAAGPAAAEKLSLGAISGYLNGLGTVQADFTQIAADGSEQTGTLYIARPGRMRFEYDPPQETLVLAAAGAVAIFDDKGDARPETYPLDRTPLNLILAETVDLTRARMVTGHRETEGGATVVTAQDPERPDTGRLRLVFTGPPVALRQWQVIDAQGGVTTVMLHDMQMRADLPDRLFNIQLNTPEGGRR